MPPIQRILDADTLKVITAGIIGFMAQLPDIELVFKIIVGFLTGTYMLIKVLKELPDVRQPQPRKPKKKHEEDED